MLAKLKTWLWSQAALSVAFAGLSSAGSHYGSKSKRGTEVAALFCTLLETAKLHNVEPGRYLREAVLAADRGEVLLPWQLAAVPS